MIRLRYSKTGGVDIEGSGEALQSIRSSILGLVQTGRGSFEVVAAKTGSPEPSESWRDRLVLEIAPGPGLVIVSVNSEVRVTGDPDSLNALASFFDAPDGAEDGWRSHYEHFSGNRWVAENSEPLTITLRRSTS